MTQTPSAFRELSRGEKLLLARGASQASSVPQLETLVWLADDADEEVRRIARETLERLSDEYCAQQLASGALPEAVARYFLDPERLRPALLPALLGNPECPQSAIVDFMRKAGPQTLPLLLEHLDLLETSALSALKDNPAYLAWQKEPRSEGVVLEADLLEMLIAESKAEAVQPVAPIAEESAEAAEQKKEGISGKIAKMTVAQKVKLALLGTREDRSLLIRDGSRVVSRAVLASPKLTDSEVESFASMKNVDQEVLRSISMSRKFMKNYSVMKNLASNPRVPLDISMTLLNRLLATDIQLLAKNRDVPDTLRKMADRICKSRRPEGS